MDFKFEARPVLALDMPPLTYDPEIKDLVFIYKAVYGFIAIDVSNYVTFNNHPRTCAPWPVSASCYLTVPACKTRTLQASYFVRTGGTTYATKLSLVVLPLLAVYNYFWRIYIIVF